MLQRFFIFLLLICSGEASYAQPPSAPSQPAQPSVELPRRVAYFPLAEAQGYPTELEPGDQLLQKSVLISNQFRDGDVSFGLSFDGKNWAKFGVGPNYASFYRLDDRQECIFSITTDYGGGREKVIKRYTLFRGRCYGIFWNSQAYCWDINEMHCKKMPKRPLTP